MKKCTYCGKEYPETAQVCAIDQEPLESDQPAVAVMVEPEPDPIPEAAGPEAENDEKPTPAGIDEDVPAGFVCLAELAPMEADHLLHRFQAAEIRFLIDRVERSFETGRGIRKAAFIAIYVHEADAEKADKMFTEDWKV